MVTTSLLCPQYLFSGLLLYLNDYDVSQWIINSIKTSLYSLKLSEYLRFSVDFRWYRRPANIFWGIAMAFNKLWISEICEYTMATGLGSSKWSRFKVKQKELLAVLKISSTARQVFHKKTFSSTIFLFYYLRI